MKRLSLLLVALFIVCGAGFAQADLYQRYANQAGVRVAMVSGLAIDSSTHVDVTLIEAENDDGWRWMKEEFYIGDLSPRQEAWLKEGVDALFFSRRSRRNPGDEAPVSGETLDVAASCYICISYLSRTVYIFCADSEEEYDAVAAILIKKMMRQ